MEVIRQDNCLESKKNIPQERNQIPRLFSRKELSLFGKVVLLGGYTVFCLFLGASIFQSKQELKGDIEQLMSLNQDILSSLGSSKQGDSINVIQSNKHFASMLETQILNTLEKRESIREQTIESQKQEVAKLKSQLQQLIIAKKIDYHQQEQTIPYNNENMRILRYQQRLQKDRFRERQLVEKDAFIMSVDMKNPTSQEKLRSFLDKQKVELYKLEQSFVKERQKFKQKKFRLSKI